jgi:hypothetical protein
MTEVCIPYMREGITWLLYFLLLYTLVLVLVLCLWLLLVFLSLYLDSQIFFYVCCQFFMHNFCSARSLSAANVCRDIDVFGSTVFGTLILTNLLSHVPCTEQHKRFICVNTWKFVAVVTHNMKFCMFHVITELYFS